VGKGNNALLIRAMIKNRWWWTIVDEIDSANFIWSQLKKNEILSKLKQLK